MEEKARKVVEVAREAGLEIITPNMVIHILGDEAQAKAISRLANSYIGKK